MICVVKIYDDMCGLLIKNKASGYTCMVFSIYLPPEGSTFYCDSTDFFNKLIVEIYKYVDIDAVYFVGDINARIGGLNDISDLDDIEPRKHLEIEYNSHGKAFIDFLHDVKCCVINGRISPENDNFTSISTKGKSVVDYAFTTHENLQNVLEFHVDTCSDIIEQLNIEYMLSDVCKAPDHSLLTFKIHTSPYVTIQCKYLGSKKYYHGPKRMYNYRNIPDDFMQSPNISQAIGKLIDDILLVRENQGEVDHMYDKVVRTIFDEMQNKLTPISKTGRRKNTPFRPYWCAELSDLWRKTYDSERIYVKFKGHRTVKEQLRQNFISNRNNFDKTLRQKQRAYRRGLLVDMEECDTSNPRKFWKHIHSLGPRKSSSIPWEVYDSDGNITCDKNTVLKTWEREYNCLFNDNNGIYDDDFLRDILSTKAHLERNMQDPLFTSNMSLNNSLSLEEVRKVVKKSKLGKACGTDSIPNEVLKNENMIKCLHALFQMCFDYSMIPSLWTPVNY